MKFITTLAITRGGLANFWEANKVLDKWLRGVPNTNSIPNMDVR